MNLSRGLAALIEASAFGRAEAGSVAANHGNAQKLKSTNRSPKSTPCGTIPNTSRLRCNGAYKCLRDRNDTVTVVVSIERSRNKRVTSG